jgi:hypothetical protein
LLIAGMVLAFVVGFFYENSRFIAFVPCVGLLFVAIHQTIRWKKFFIIREVSTENAIK